METLSARLHRAWPAMPIRQARALLMKHGEIPANGLDPFVARSWNRSLGAGLSPVGRISAIDNLNAFELQRQRSQNHALISHALPVMEYLLEQVSSTHSMVVLADPQGVLMNTLGDLDFLSKAERVALVSGASWHEGHRGTNAIGTALAEGFDVEIHGAEHFLERNGFLTCAAAPVIAADGRLLGVLDISGDQRSHHPHTLGLVSTAARMIENSLMLSGSGDHVLVTLHLRAQGVGSIAQGMLSFTEDGWLAGVNRRGLELMGLSPRSVHAVTWEHLFAMPWSDLLRRGQGADDRPFAVETIRHHTLYAKVRAQHRAWVSPGAPRSRPGLLSQLDTGDSRWRAAADKALKVCDKDIPVLVLGESGVGKELFARALHDASARRDQPFVAINCAAIPEHLIESELFGYVPGAFTGAAKNGSAGRLREAQGGTLFLDEIGDMPLALQTRLLRVLQERKVVPLGGARPVDVQFALICATHHPLKQAVESGRFRADLYYRINGLTLQLPALREREDFAALTQRLLDQLGDGSAVDIDPDLHAALACYRWPGNLRQYSHLLRTALALLEPRECTISWRHLPDDLAEELLAAQAVTPSSAVAPPQNLQELSALAIRQALENCRGNVSAAARQLGISRQTLYRRLSAGPRQTASQA